MIFGPLQPAVVDIAGVEKAGYGVDLSRAIRYQMHYQADTVQLPLSVNVS